MPFFFDKIHGCCKLYDGRVLESEDTGKQIHPYFQRFVVAGLTIGSVKG